MKNDNNSTQETIVPNGQKPVCINFGAPINPATAARLTDVLSKAVNASHDEIHLFLSTPGGTVQEGIAIYNFIRSLPVPLITYNISQVSSIGNVIYQAGQKKVASTTSSFMFHGVGVALGNAHLELKELRERTKSIEIDQELITRIMARHTPLSLKKINSMFLQMEFFSADQALESGITDEVTDFRLPPEILIISPVFQG